MIETIEDMVALAASTADRLQDKGYNTTNMKAEITPLGELAVHGYYEDPLTHERLFFWVRGECSTIQGLVNDSLAEVPTVDSARKRQINEKLADAIEIAEAAGLETDSLSALADKVAQLLRSHIANNQLTEG